MTATRLATQACLLPFQMMCTKHIPSQRTPSPL